MSERQTVPRAGFSLSHSRKLVVVSLTYLLKMMMRTMIVIRTKRMTSLLAQYFKSHFFLGASSF